MRDSRIREGDRYGRLTVLRESGTDDRHNRKWLCVCDCGNRKVVRGSSLLTGNTTSCGCLRRESSIKLELNGEAKTIEEWARCLDMDSVSIRRRLYEGWEAERALTTPIRYRDGG